MARGQWTQGSGGGLDTSEVTATAAQVLKGYTAGVKDSDEPQEGTLEVQSIVNFNVALYGSLSLIGTWQNPERGPYSGVMIRYKVGDYPENIDDGLLAYEGAETSFTLNGLIDDTIYYFRAWPYMTTNYGRIYSIKYLDIYYHVFQTEGIVSITSSGSWTVPENVAFIDIFGVGGGGGGDGADYTWQGDDTGYVWQDGRAGGGAGYTQTIRNIAVKTGDVISATIGAGGRSVGVRMSNGGTNCSGQVGSATTVNVNNTVIMTANPGRGAGRAGAAGGSGGGYYAEGGSDGSDGKGRNSSTTSVGIGQHTTTRAFGESENTLYAGGGGGRNGAGGAGGGGSGYSGNGSFGTGGGGGSSSQGSTYGGGTGGSGLVLIRWHRTI